MNIISVNMRVQQIKKTKHAVRSGAYNFSPREDGMLTGNRARQRYLVKEAVIDSRLGAK